MDRQFFEKIKYIKFDEFLDSAPIYFRASIFDHILSETEAQELLGKVSKEDQEARNYKTDYFILRLS
jgi:hypothetical protein